MTAKRARPTPELKARVALACLQERRPAAEIAEEYGITEKQALEWKAQLIEQAGFVFASDTDEAAGDDAGPAPDDDREFTSTLAGDPDDPDRYTFAGNLVYWGRVFETMHNRAFVLEIRPERVSVAVWRVMAWLTEMKSLTVGQLATHTHMERTVLGRLLDRMAQQGLIVREPNAEDRRISETRLTPHGRKVFARIQPVRQAIYRRAIADIDERDLELARSVMERMVANLNRPSDLQ